MSRMTEQEAIRDIKRQLWEINSEDADITLSTESLKMAIKALEKQIPMKPIVGKLFAECPICRNDEIFNEMYCSHCGQKLDWE